MHEVDPFPGKSGFDKLTSIELFTSTMYCNRVTA